MSVTVGEYSFEEAAPPAAPPQAAQPARPAAPDMDRIRLALRRDAERAQRTWAD